MTRSEAGVALALSRRPNRIVVGVVLLIGLSLAWYWMLHDRLDVESNVGGSRVSPGALHARWRA